MNEELIAKSSPKNAYAAPQLKVYGGMKNLTASGSMGIVEASWCNPRLRVCRRP